MLTVLGRGASRELCQHGLGARLYAERSRAEKVHSLDFLDAEMELSPFWLKT